MPLGPIKKNMMKKKPQSGSLDKARMGKGTTVKVEKPKMLATTVKKGRP